MESIWIPREGNLPFLNTPQINLWAEESLKRISTIYEYIIYFLRIKPRLSGAWVSLAPGLSQGCMMP